MKLIHFSGLSVFLNSIFSLVFKRELYALLFCHLIIPLFFNLPLCFYNNTFTLVLTNYNYIFLQFHLKNVNQKWKMYLYKIVKIKIYLY